MSDIKYAYPLILNKVASPQYATPVLRRERLLDWLNQAANCRAAVIAADAGYGKTTLLWQWEREADFPCYWYKLDRTDRDWTFHISYLIEAISKRHKGFGRRAHSMLQQLGGPNSSRPGVAAYLLAEMHQRLTEPCTFIIDDWQYVNAVTEVRGLWNQILRDAPATCRFVFASRVKPKLQFARFKTHGGYAELRTDALRFTESEIGELFRDVYNNPLDPAELLELDRRTEGWAASLQLVEVSLRERQTPDQRLAFIRSITATRDSDLFDFLAEEVLDQQPEESRDFLLATSILQQITPEVAERLTGSHDGRKSLTDLEQRGLFTSQLDENRYRYHNLFRDFLERRLVAERSEAEVSGLHIHAASYFETTAQWPEAIHHYLRAGLQRQAARLIARYGEDVVEDGRLGLVDEWLQQLPKEAIKANARLSLLWGEASGMRGDWDVAIEALERARTYFARKGDRRLEALACLKLSSVFSNYGDPRRAADIARTGLEIAPEDAIATRLRLQGNLTITHTWLEGSLEDVVNDCRQIAAAARRLGLEHYAAIANHNEGEALTEIGRFEEAVASLDAASRFWAESPTHPFADNADLVRALLCTGDVPQARREALQGAIRTRPWQRSHAMALYGLAEVLMAEARVPEAIVCLEEGLTDASVLGIGVHQVLLAALVEAVWLNDESPTRVQNVGSVLSDVPVDPRCLAAGAWARALVIHSRGDCAGECLEAAEGIAGARRQGAKATAITGDLKFGLLQMEHRPRRAARQAWGAVDAALASGLDTRLRPWLRRYARFAQSALSVPRGAQLLAHLGSTDPEGWRGTLVIVIEKAAGVDRETLLTAVAKHADKRTIEALSMIGGRDIAETRRRLLQANAERLYLRTFGGVSLHRGDWTGPALPIERKRVRVLLALLASRSRTGLSRDAALELMWPEADPEAAVNSLNQAVFQLRRCIDAAYRGGTSPEYVINTPEQLGLNPDLVRVDIAEIARLSERVRGLDWDRRNAVAARLIGLIRGEFLADLQYEEWTAVQQLRVHNDVRSHLLPIAAEQGDFSSSVAVSAGAALLVLDPFDEAAVLALADSLAKSGQRVAARNIVVDYVQRMHGELDERPTPALERAAVGLGAAGRIKRVLTAAPGIRD